MAGWDEFLTERDKQHVAIWGKKDRDEFGSKPVVLVIDVHYNSLGHERKPLFESIKDWPMSCGLDGWSAVDRTVELLASARANDVPVIYVRGLEGFPSDSSRVRERGNARNRRIDHLPPETRALANEIVAEIAPKPGELVIGKATSSAFGGTPLLYYLHMLRADTVIVCGESTSGCVRAAVLDAAALRYRVGIVGDCCYDRTQASHWMNLFDMHQKYGEVIDLNQARDYFSSLSANASPQRKSVRTA